MPRLKKKRVTTSMLISRLQPNSTIAPASPGEDARNALRQRLFRQEALQVAHGEPIRDRRDCAQWPALSVVSAHRRHGAFPQGRASRPIQMTAM